MQISDIKIKKSEAGFTLVELAIVMIIIGLLIGGILKGQELVANAQITATIAQIKGIDSALSTFRDKYSALPGDMTNPAGRLRNCTAAPCNDAGNNNSRIDTPNLGTAPVATSEGLVAFTHLAASDLIAGIDMTGTPNFGSALPEAKVGGGFWLGHTANGNASGLAAGSLRPGHYLVMNAIVGAIAAGSTTGVTATQAGQIDRKLDDGVPATGDVQSIGSNCRAGADYNEAAQASNCSMYMRVQG